MPRTVAALAIGLILLGFVQTGRGLIEALPGQLPVLRAWPDAVAQARLQLGPELADLLTAADQALPARAALLLVTPGLDPRHAEYTAFHRALYQLAPRPVWWANPAPGDGTWEARWWITSPLDGMGLAALASERGASHLLFYRVPAPDGLGPATALTPAGTVVSVRTPPAGSYPPTGGSDPLGLLVGLVVPPVIGYLAVRGPTGRPAGLGVAESTALAWPIGLGLVTLLMSWLQVLGQPLERQSIAIAMLAAGAGVIALARARRAVGGAVAGARPSTWRPTGRRPLCLALALVSIAPVAIVALWTIGRPLLYWDSWVNFALKARIVVRESAITDALFAEPSRLVTHPDYPLLLPLAEAWLFRWSGTLDDRLAGLIATLFFLALLGVGYAALRRRGLGATWALVGLGGLAWMPGVNGLATLAFADFPLAVYATIAGVYALEWLERRSAPALLVAAVAAGLMPWTKREGLVLLVALLGGLLLAGRARRPAWLAVGACALAALLLAGPWWILVAARGIASADFLPLAPATLVAQAGRLPSIAYHVARSLMSPTWCLVWPLFALGVMVTARRGKRDAFAYLWPATALLYLSAMSLSYVFSAYVPYQQHVVSSIDRLVGQVTPLLALWLASTFLSDRPKLPRTADERRGAVVIG